MIKSFLNGVIGGFSRTLGRILFYIFIALIFYFIFGLKNVDAAELNINSYVYSTMGNTFYQRMFTGSNYYGGSTSESNFSLGTTYSGRLRQIHFRVDRTFNYTNTYTLTLQANSTDFRNYLDTVLVTDMQNSYMCTTISSQFISKSKISVTFNCPYQTNSVLFDFYAREGQYFLTGDTNFNIKNVLLEEHTSGQSNDDIINNNNENTQDIINNANSNTQDIINNQNDLIKTCYTNLFNASNYTNVTSGVSNLNISNNNITFAADRAWQTINYHFNVELNETYTLHFTTSNYSSAVYYSFNDSNWWELSPTDYKQITPNTSHLYIRVQNKSVSENLYVYNQLMLVKGNVSTYLKLGETCTNRLDDLNGSIGNLNDTLTNQTPANTNIFSDWWSNLTQNYYSNPLGNLITLPINLVQKLINYSNTACQPVQLGSLLGTNLTLTCFTLGDIITNSVVLNVIDLIMSLSLIVFTLKKAYETVSNLLSLGGENEVKKHFKFPTPMEFIASLFGGGR